MKGDQAMILRRLALIDKLSRAGADKDVPDRLLTDLDDNELNKLAVKYGFIALNQENRSPVPVLREKNVIKGKLVIRRKNL